MARWDREGRAKEVIIAWWILCMVWASMRFDDAIHVRPDSIHMDACAMRCRAWQTKVERRRRGTSFAVCDVAVAEPGWLRKGLTRYRAALPQGREDIDFWLCDIHAEGLNFESVLSYGRFVTNAKALLLEAVELDWSGTTEAQAAVREAVLRFTAHSPRVTIIDAMAHGGADTTTMQVQGNWKDDSMPLKYVRNRKSIPINFITKMAKDLAAREGRRDAAGSCEEKTTGDSTRNSRTV